MFKKLYLFPLIMAVLGMASAEFLYYWYVLAHPGDMISEERITSILGRESHVYYNDGKTVLGTFFDQSHRQYVQYKDIPENFVKALTAAEDSRFFVHPGIDIKGIARAAVKNIQAMRVVEGGSTLTQQTAKNLYQRADRSWRSKLAELLFALRLEHYYSKEKIFEFYANQFFVTGNGHGLAIASRYYFDKNLADLSLVECAYIAGSVKRPNYYNPFIKKNEDDRKTALVRCRQRTAYVLEQMRKLSMISEVEYRQAIKEEIGFRQGKIGYALDYVMEMAREAADAPEVTAALERHGITNIATAGLKVITTVDKDVQRQTIADLRHQLSLLDTTLSGYERAAVREAYRGVAYEGDAELQPGGYFPGVIETIAGQGGRPAITVDLGEKRGKGVIDQAGFSDMQAAFSQHRQAGAGASLLAQLAVGDTVWVTARRLQADGTALLTLEKFPTVMGGAIVLRHGQVLAVAGGVENRFFNRAMAAQRTMGSAFKPFLYAAALQLGWNSADMLDNRRNVFVYHGQPYFPRPDHFSPYERVSLSYAGVHSENVATIWLLAHLCDQLSPEQFQEVAGHLDLTPRQDESYNSYVVRIRDRMGIQVNDAALTEAAYRLALATSSDDFVFGNLMEDCLKLRSLPYGGSYARFAEGLAGSTSWAGSRDADEAKELSARAAVLSQNFARIEETYGRLRAYRQRLADLLDFTTPENEAPEGGSPEAALFYDDFGDRYFFLPPRQAPSSLRRLSEMETLNTLTDMTAEAREDFWRGVMLPGGVSAAAVEIVIRQMEAEKARLAKSRPYSFEVLSELTDFRILVGIEYLRALGRRLGIASKLDGVLSLPLGSSVVTLFEATRMYEGLITGQVSLYGDGNPALSVLARIESTDGDILYRPTARDSTVIDEKSRLQLGHVLESVVLLGTGKRARREVRLFPGQALSGPDKGMAVPLLGKTGTANNYANASFFGYLPALSETGDAFVTEDGHAIGVYVGYDDNQPMRAGGLRVSGAVGALPVWIGIAADLLRELNYEKRLDPVDVSFNGLMLKRERLGQQFYAADPEQGGALEEPPRVLSETDRSLPSILTFAESNEGGDLRLERYFAPFWKNGE